MAVNKPTSVDSPYTTTTTTVNPTQVSTVVSTTNTTTVTRPNQISTVVDSTVVATSSPKASATSTVAPTPYASSQATSVSLDTTVNTTTSTLATSIVTSADANTNYYVQGAAGLNQLVESGKIFRGANVYLTVEDQRYITNNIIDQGGNATPPAGSNSQIQFNSGGSFGANTNLTWDGANIVTTGIKTNNYYYANGVPFTGSGSYGNSNVATFLSAFGSNTISTTGNVTADNLFGNIQGLNGNISGLTTVNLDVVNISARDSSGVNIGAGGYNNLLVLEDEVLIQNVPLTTAGNITGNNITANTVTATDSADLASLNIYAATISMTNDQWDYITITPNIEGQAFLQLPKDSVANVDDVRLHNGAGNIELGTGSGSYNWYFGNTGAMSTPGNIDIGGSINFNSGGIVQTPDEDFTILVQDADDDGFALYQVVDDGASNPLSSTRLQRDQFDINIDIPGASYTWQFDDAGRFNLPGNIQGIYGGDTSFYAYDNGSGGMIEMKTISYIGDTLLANVTVHHPNVTISTQNAAYTWTFDGTGNLVLPLSGNLVGATPNNNGYISWFGNSSGDGGGYTTMNLVPDDTRVGGDQYLILDPTAPGHIHIRAGGTQDNSGAELYLGGENSYFKVDSGPNPDVVVATDGEQWTFSQGQLILANGLSTIQSLASSSLDPLNPNVSTMVLTPDPSYSLQALVLDPTAPGHIHLRSPSFVGNIDDPSANLFLGGESSSFEVGYGANANVFVHSNGNTWTFDNSGNLNYPDGTISTGGAIYAAAGASVQMISNNAYNQVRVDNANVEIYTSVNGITQQQWTFDGAGNLTLPGNIAGNTGGYAIGYRDIPQVTFSANATAAVTDAGKHYYSTTAGNLQLTLPDNSNVAFPTGATLTLVVNAAGNVLVNQGTGVTLYMAGSSTTGNRVVGAYGLASVMKVAANTWVISGTGVY